MIGARTLAALGVATLACLWAAQRGVLSIAHLEELTATTALLIGLFASISVVFVITLWHPEGASVFAVGLHRSRLVAGVAAKLGRRASDLPLAGQRALYLVAFLAIGLGSFDNAAAGELEAAWHKLGERGSEYCRERDRQAPAVKKAAPIADQRGCALVRRAYELGYEKSLGTCAPKEPADSASTATALAAATPCKKRQSDEPLLHYMWRVLAKRGGDASGAVSSFSPSQGIARLRIKLEYLDELFAVPKHSVLGSPHAAHHIWTNLEAPRERSWIGEAFSPPRCVNAAGLEPPALTWSSASLLLESALGQLVLSPRYGPPTYACDELTIHWGASIDTCARIASNPTAALEASSALDSIEAVLERQQSLVGRDALARRLGERRIPAPPASRVVSFSCFMVGEARSQRLSAELGGQRFEVRDMAVAQLETRGAAQLEIYQALSELLGGARYAGAIDDTSAAARRIAGPLDPNSLEGDDFALARLELLVDTDPFLGDSWPLERGDLTEVYPFESHLRPVVTAFRRRYSKIRGRL